MLFLQKDIDVYYYQDEIRIFDLLVSNILLKHQKNGFTRLLCKKEYLYNSNSKLDYYNDLEFISVSSYQTEFLSRNITLELMNEYVECVKDIFSLHVEIGYINDNNFVGYIAYNNEFINVINIQINYKNDLYQVVVKYHNSIIDIVKYYLKEYKLITPNFRNSLGLVILEKNDPNSRIIFKELLNKYELRYNNIVSAREQYQELELDGYQFILELRKKGKLRIKVVGIDIYQDILIEDIDNFIEVNKVSIDQKLYQLSLKNSIKLLNKKAICSSCLNKVNNYFFTFNQRGKKECYLCNNASNRMICFIKMEGR